jgi:hypothetical protein
VKRFRSRAVELKGGLTVRAPVRQAFPLFSPQGEKRWVPGWRPRILYPREAAWERGLLFTTREERAEAVWVVTALERNRHAVEYHRVEPGRYVARVRVRCRSAGRARTRALVHYAFFGLSKAGNREVAALSAEAYRQKMRRWEAWIGECLAAAGRRKRGGRGWSGRRRRS